MPLTSHTATTSTRAKASFKKNGPRLPAHEMRRIERGAILDRRAEELKEREVKKKRAREKQRLREAREREGRAKMGLGLATQLVGFSHSQKGMKGAMEGFLGITKRTESAKEEKENTIVEEMQEERDATSLEDTIEEDLFDDDICLEEFEKSADEQGNTGEARLHDLDNKHPKTHTAKEATDITARRRPSITYKPASPQRQSPPRSETNLTESRYMSPPDMWGDLFATGTQICRELSQPKTPSTSFMNPARIDPHLIEDLEPRSDDLFDSTKKTSNPPIDISEGIVAHDFAYFKKTCSQNIILGDRVVPKSPSSFGSLKRKRGHKFPNVIATPSPKTTTNCSSFTAAQISFTADLTKYGISTQIVADMFGEESDTDEEDFSFQVPPAPERSTEASMQKDRVLMPPPPLRKSPKIFKPPSKEASPPETKDGLGIGIFGVSTQDIRAVFLDDNGSDTEEDEFGPSLPSPPSRSEAEQISQKFPNPHINRIPPPKRLQPSPFMKPMAKKPRLASAQAPPQLRRLRTSPASGSWIESKTTSQTRSFSAPPFPTSPAPMNDLHRFGISTQILNDFAEEDIELSPVDTKDGQGFGKLDSTRTKETPTAEVSGGRPIEWGGKPASSSFGVNDEMDAVLWGEDVERPRVVANAVDDDGRLTLGECAMEEYYNSLAANYSDNYGDI